MPDNALSDLDANMQPLAQQWLQACAAKGLDVRITVTWRDATDQNAAQAAGLSNACAGQSPHNCTLPDGTPAARAFDFAVFGLSGVYIKDGTDSRYTEAGEVAESLGLAWGGRWKHPDFDHIECRGWQNA